MWILAKAAKGGSSNLYDANSPTGNLVLISDTSDMVIYAKLQGIGDAPRLLAQRGRDTYFIGPEPVSGVVQDLVSMIRDLAKQMSAVEVA